MYGIIENTNFPSISSGSVAFFKKYGKINQPNAYQINNGIKIQIVFIKEILLIFFNYFTPTLTIKLKEP